MANSTRRHGTRKPAKPYPDFPLFPHATGRWAKKIRGKFYYFGPWDDPNGALQLYLDQKDDLHAGRAPRAAKDGLTVGDLLNRFLTSKKLRVDTGEIAKRTFTDYHATCKRIQEAFGLGRLVEDLGADDFQQLRKQLARTRGPVALGNEVQRVRTVFKFAHDSALIDKPVRFGPNFKRPSKKVLRKARHEKGPRMFEADELRQILDAAPQPLKAMILLGINCGFGNADVGTLPISALDLFAGYVDYPRPKTGIPRRCPIWPETVEALRAALARRPKAKRDEERAFITKYGKSWAKEVSDNPIAKETSKLLKKLGLYRPSRGFYALRHTFETIGGESRDQVAVNHIMGHARDDMASAYRQRISDERLKAVTDHVRTWLFSKDAQDGAVGGNSAPEGPKA